MTDPVLIVGAGPTGLTAGLELSRMGVPVRLIDKRKAPATTSRAIGVQARTLELFEQLGLAEEMVRLGDRGRFASIYGGGKRVFRLDFGHVEQKQKPIDGPLTRRIDQQNSCSGGHERAACPSGTHSRRSS